MKVTVHKTQSCYKVHVVIGEPQLPCKDSNTAVYLHFVQMTQAHLFLVQVKPIIFLQMPPVQGQFHPVFPQHVFCILSYCLEWNPFSNTFHILVNCCLVCNWCNSKFIQIYDNSCTSIIHNAHSNSRRLTDALKSRTGVRQYHGSGG